MPPRCRCASGQAHVEFTTHPADFHGSSQTSPVPAMADTDIGPASCNEDLQLAQRAAAGEVDARRAVAALIDPIARARAAKYCKRFCGRNRLEYYCTVDSAYGVQRHDAARCEWGSFSYFFFFDALASPRNLRRYEARDGATLSRFLHAVAASLGLWERWKNKRFQRRVHVLKAIAALDPDASRIYFGLLDGDVVPNMAQRLSRSESEVDGLAKAVKRILVQERRLYQMQEGGDVSLSILAGTAGEGDETDGSAWEPPSDDPPMEQVQILERLTAALPQLTWLEQFIIQAMIMESLPAEAVLQALREENVSIKPGQGVEDANINQVYYLRDKTLAKLRRMCNL